MENDIDPWAAQRLWGCILNRNLLDLLWDDPKSNDFNGNATVTMRDQHEARMWFGSRDFRTVCYLAGTTPEFVEDHVRPLLRDKAAARAFCVRMNGDHHRRGRRAKVAA